MPPTLANGKICYIEMPTTHVAQSADFYKRVFGWNIRKRGNGVTSFDDTTGEVSGSWVLGRVPSATAGLLFYIMVDNVAAALKAVVANGGAIVQQIGADAPVGYREVPRSWWKRDWPLSIPFDGAPGQKREEQETSLGRHRAVFFGSEPRGAPISDWRRSKACS